MASQAQQRADRKARIEARRQEALDNYTTKIEIIDGVEVEIKVYEPVGKKRLTQTPDIGVVL